MKEHAAPACRWIYEGAFGMVVDWFRLPPHPPLLPASEGDQAESFRPSTRWLDYLKFKFWLGLIPTAVGLLAGFVGASVAMAAEPKVGVLIVVPILAGVVLLTAVASVISFVTLHLRYDTTWYVMSDRSLRIRRGVWTLHETTITFDNVQNIRIDQGPLERYMGVANLLVETAGGGGGVVTLENAHAAHGLGFHRGLIEGIDNAEELREKILARQRHAPTSGLGDEEPHEVAARRHQQAIPPAPTGGWSPAHVAVLREIRELALRASADITAR